MGKYCCFTCPKGDFSEKSLHDCCPECGREFGFPLFRKPAVIGEYDVIAPLQRGFYGATYVAERRSILRTREVLKVIPIKMYAYFNKDFRNECLIHNRVAQSSEHIVGIRDLFNANISFQDTSIECHVAVLDYIEGVLLGDYLRGDAQLTAGSAAQIAADLFSMKAELERSLINHNDLHADNIIIQRLSKGMYRQGAMDPTIRAVAIDLGSLADDRRSGGQYRSDLHWIGTHIQEMVKQLHADRDGVSDLDARVAHALQLIAQLVSPAVENQRTPSAEDIKALIEKEYFRSAEPWRPWHEQLRLRTFGSSYNAQTLDAWHVPQLLVDPEGAWLAQVSAPGPLVITGMRGCGKTLLLRALQFHARAARQSTETDTDVVLRLDKDHYVGLFVSAQRLLSIENGPPVATNDLFARLYVAYALETSRALAHLADLDPARVSRGAHIGIAEAVAAALLPAIEVPDLATIEHLERYLSGLLIQVSRSDAGYALAAHPSNAFPLLAEAIRRASPMWATAQVLFLLDDVSTRYMTGERIEGLLSALIFQNAACAFKITSEAQTIFLSLKSPGQVNPAAPFRDFATFDLGADVHERLRNHTNGKRFVEEILSQRAKFYANHPNLPPSRVLGDATYEEIADTIAKSTPDSGDRKRVYRGITALTGVCVGDIGSVINLYEDFLTRAGGQYPVADNIQTEVYQDFCSRQLYLLDRRGAHFKDAAKSFAEASHLLLVQSARKGGKRRLRQYASIYVRVTTGNIEKQMTRLRELVDAGVFVFTGGSPRTKTRDSNPTQQFKLTYRKIFGLVNYIGLSERDRFELSGADLEAWLENPASGRDILMKNLSPGNGNGTSEQEAEGTSEASGPGIMKANNLDHAPELPLEHPTSSAMRRESLAGASLRDTHLPLPRLKQVDLGSLAKTHVRTLVVGLGFEDRALESVLRITRTVRPERVVAIEYKEPGYKDSIIRHFESVEIPIEIIAYKTLQDGLQLDLGEGTSLVDVTGLAKPAIFRSLRSALARSGGVLVAYTAAAQYYPLDEDLRRVLEAQATENHHELLIALKNVLTGEEAPYSLVPLLSTESDGTRMRALCAFASSKHQRLLNLVEKRDYDQMDIVVDESDSDRARVAQIAAEVAVRESQNGVISKCPYQQSELVLQQLGRRYEAWYLRDGLNFEIGLTGNKLQAVAAAALSAAAHVSQVWYVAPARFDRLKFTKGSGATICLDIGLASVRLEREPV